MHVLYPLTPCFPLQDFALLPEKDKTPLIEGGVTLSGGQRARLGLARYFLSHLSICLNNYTLISNLYGTMSFCNGQKQNMMYYSSCPGKTYIQVNIASSELFFLAFYQIINLFTRICSMLRLNEVREFNSLCCLRISSKGQYISCSVMHGSVSF